MTNERTVDISGPRDIRICPVCNSDQIEGQDINFNSEGRLTQNMICLDCDKEWIDNYRYVSYTITYIKEDSND